MTQTSDDLPIKISPDDINRYVADRIIESALGVNLRKAIKKTVEEISNSYPNPWESTIKTAVQSEIQRLLMTEYKETIQEKARDYLTNQMTDDFVTRAFDALMKPQSRY